MPPNYEQMTVAGLLAEGRRLRESRAHTRGRIEPLVMAAVPECLWESIRWESDNGREAILVLEVKGITEIVFGFTAPGERITWDDGTGFGKWGVRGRDGGVHRAFDSLVEALAEAEALHGGRIDVDSPTSPTPRKVAPPGKWARDKTKGANG